MKQRSCRTLLSTVSILLILMLMLSANLTVYATEAEEWMAKISKQTLQKMSAVQSNESIRVWIWMADIDRETAEKQIEEETGYTAQEIEALSKPVYQQLLVDALSSLTNTALSDEERAIIQAQCREYLRQQQEDAAVIKTYQQSRNRILSEIYSAHNSAILKELAIPEDRISFISTTSPSAIVKLCAPEIESIARSDKIMSVEYDDIDEKNAPLPIEPTHQEYLYADRLTAYLSGKDPSEKEVNNYEELFYHEDQNGTTDWVLINADCGWPILYTGFTIIGNRVLVMGPHTTFRYGMALYDVKEDTFYDLSVLQNYDRYDGLPLAIDTYGKGKLLGDIDGDDEINITDATVIQRCETGLAVYPASDVIDPYKEIDPSFKPLQYYSDFNRDGERSIIDATMIQRYATGLTV